MRPVQTETVPLAPIHTTFNIEPANQPRTKAEKEEQAMTQLGGKIGALFNLRNANRDKPQEKALEELSSKEILLLDIRLIYKGLLHDRTFLHMVTYKEDVQTRYKAFYEYKGKARRLIVVRVEGNKEYRRLSDEEYKLLSQTVKGKHGRAFVDTH